MQGSGYLMLILAFTVLFISSFENVKALDDPRLFFTNPDVALQDSTMVVFIDSSKIDGNINDIIDIDVRSISPAPVVDTIGVTLTEIGDSGKFIGPPIKFKRSIVSTGSPVFEMNADVGWDIEAETTDLPLLLVSGTIGSITGGTQQYADERGDILFADCNQFGGDFDKDGMCTDWETGDVLLVQYNGPINYDYNCHPACDDQTKDIFLEIDYMKGHAPTQLAIDHVVDAFANSNVDNDYGEVISGTENYLTGQGSQAFDFDGNTNITLNNPLDSFDFDASDNFSVSFSIKKSTDGSPDVIISDKETIWGNDEGWVLFTLQDKIYLRMADGTNDIQIKLSEQVLNDQWRDITFVWSGENLDASDVSFFVNGNPSASVAQVSNTISSLSDPLNPQPVVIGATSDGSNKLTGEIDDVKIYGFDLETIQVSDLLDLISPIASYQFEDTPFDSTENDNDGTITAGSEKYLTRDDGTALNFDGSLQIRLNNPSDSFDFAASDAFSIAFWIKKASDSSWNVIISDKEELWDKKDEGWVLFSRHGQIYFRMTDTNDNVIQSKFSAEVLDGTWKHVVAVWKGGNDELDMALYVDGFLSSGTTTNKQLDATISNLEPVVFGATSDGGKPLTGEIDDIQIYGFDLSATQVAKLFSIAPTARYQFEDSSEPGIIPDSINGIRLHVQVDHKDFELIPHNIDTIFPGDDDDAPQDLRGFDQIKAVYFGTDDERGDRVDWENTIWDNKRQAFHYFLMAHQRSGETTTGTGETPGNDAMITLGVTPSAIGNLVEQEGTLMHELGHNLDLGHGGQDDINCKPNYISVMSHSRQFPYFVSPNVDVLDFSHEIVYLMDGVTDTIHEGALDETLGIGHYNEPEEEEIIFGNPAGGITTEDTGSTCVNWDSGVDCDVNPSPPYPLEINSWTTLGGDPFCILESTSHSPLTSYSDWDQIDLKTREQGAWDSGREVNLRDQKRVEVDISAVELTNKDIQTMRIIQIDNLELFLKNLPLRAFEESEEVTKKVEIYTTPNPLYVKNIPLQKYYQYKYGGNFDLEFLNAKITFSSDTEAKEENKSQILRKLLPILEKAREKVRQDSVGESIIHISEFRTALDVNLVGIDKKIAKEKAKDVIGSQVLAAQISDPTIEKLPAPYRQIDEGVSFDDVKCNRGLFLMIDSEVENSICVKKFTGKSLQKIDKWSDYKFLSTKK